MKKYIGLVVLGLLCATSALAQTTWEKCNANNGGTLVTVAEKTLCKANKTMNWWSAYSWCQGIGGHLPTIQELCRPEMTMTDGASCGYNYGSRMWTATHQASGASATLEQTSLRYGRSNERGFSYAVNCLPN